MTARTGYDLAKAAEIVSTLDSSKQWVIEITETRAKRTNEQNRLLWAIYTGIARATGHTTEEIHEACKAMFLPPHTVKIGERYVTVSGSTVTDKMTFSEYVERVQSWASSELGVQP